MSRSFNARIRKRAAAKVVDRPANIFTFVASVTHALERAFGGGTKGLIKNLDEFIEALLSKSMVSALLFRLLKLKKLLGSGPKVRVLKPDQAGTYLKARIGKFKEFAFPDETRRTGGILEARALKFDDGSVEFEMAGTVRESIAILRGDIELQELGIKHKGLDYSKDLPPAGGKVYKGISLSGYDRAHLWGPGFGDEARAGIMYAPAEFNRSWQNNHIEDRIRVAAERVRAEGGEFILKVKARSYAPEEPFLKSVLRNKDQEFLLKEIKYEIEVRNADGTVRGTATIEFDIPPPGKVGTIEPNIMGADLLPAVSEFA